MFILKCLVNQLPPVSLMSMFAVLVLMLQSASLPPKTAAGDDAVAAAPPPTNLESPDTRSGPSFEQLLQLQSVTQKIILQSTPAVVAIDQSGSGVIVSPGGIVLTASHVTRIANRKVLIAMADGRIVEGITLGSNLASDTGAIQLLEPGPFPFLSVQDSQSADPGTWCITMGYPLSFPRGKPAAGRLGRVLNRQSNGKLVTDCTIMGGDSGGPLLNLDGKVIAISSSVKLGINQNLFIPSEQFIKDWRNIAMSIDRNGFQSTASQQTIASPPPANAAASPPPQAPSTSGFKVTKRPQNNRSNKRAYFGINAETDQNIVRIRAVHRQSPAERAGVQRNDVIVALDSARITNFSQIVKTLRKHSPGDQIRVIVNRYGSLLTLTVTLGNARTK